MVFFLEKFFQVDVDSDKMHSHSDYRDSDIELSNENESDTTELLSKNKKNPVWSFAFYQEFFDVDSSTILKRIKGSLIPMPNSTFIGRFIKGKPDMYGPFWICATLVLSIGICGNLSTLLNNLNDPKYKYKPQFELLPVAAVIIYCYAFILPLLIKAFLWWKNRSSSPAVSQIICLYGYSLFIYIPSSVLFIVPYAAFNWLVVSIAISLSGAVIMISLWPIFKGEPRKTAVLFIGLLFALHVVTMVMLRLYFFSPISSSNKQSLNLPSSMAIETVTNKTSGNH